MNRLRDRRRAGGGATDADVAAWRAAVIANSGTVSAGTLAAVNTFVLSAKASGYWSKLLRINLFCGDQLAAALVPLKVGGGNATDTNVNFVSGDYTEATGLTGNGSSKYLRTGIVADTMLTTNSTHVAFYNRSGGVIGGTLGASDGSNNAVRLFAPLNASTNAQTNLYSTAAAGRIVAAVTAPFGLVIGSRTGAAAHVLYQNGSSVGTSATTDGVLPALELYVLANNNAGAANNFAPAACGAYSVGSGLTAGEVAAYTAHMETFQDALGRGVA